MKSLSLKRNY